MAFKSVVFLTLGRENIFKKSNGSEATEERRFRAMFGTGPHLCSLLWSKVVAMKMEHMPRSARPKHLLWSLMFLKLYDPVSVLATLADADDKTFREWSWYFVEAAGNLAFVATYKKFAPS